MKTSELSGAALDWAVAKCEGLSHRLHGHVPYSTDWAQGGPIIERERIDIEHYELPENGWMAGIINLAQAHGPTPLIAAMRCYVASKLGNEVNVPNELTGVNK